MESTVQKTTKTTSTKTVTSGEVQDSSQRCQALSIAQKGQFFSDAFFEDTRQDFQDAIKDVLTKWGGKSSATEDDVTSYRSLRTRELKDENQAIRSSDDELHHKVNNMASESYKMNNNQAIVFSDILE